MRSRGSAGVHKERGMRGEKRQELGRPLGSSLREGRGARHTDHEPRKGKPGHGGRPEPNRTETKQVGDPSRNEGG